jgi:NAD+ synthase
MTNNLSIALAQINPTVGDIDGNLKKILSVRNSSSQNTDLIVYGELVVSGYPPEDLVLKHAFQDAVKAGVNKLAEETADSGPGLLIGAPWREGGKLHNAILLLDGGKITAIQSKFELPNYGVFDEKRVFAPGALPGPIAFRGVRLGAMVCEDMWFPEVSECLQESGAEILIVLNGSPFESNKPDNRLNPAVARIAETGLALAYVNLVGGQDELVFDGGSFVLGADKKYKAKAPSWIETTILTNWSRSGDEWVCSETNITMECEDLEAIYRALVLGLRDYVRKNGFPGVLIGLSGGIDSALSAAVAVDALGADLVNLVLMPSPFTSKSSIIDAEETARQLNCKLDIIPIDPAMKAFNAMLSKKFANHKKNETEENIQARTRGMILMALSNKFGHMVLSTGNKSEMSVGYATLYGDMCGGYSVLKDVYKTKVFELALWRNKNKPGDTLGPKASGEGSIIPQNVITKPPTAELKFDQTDQDTLPPYEELDAILKCLIEEEMSLNGIVALGHNSETADKVMHMLNRAEYKRRQAPPGVKITRRSFGRDRRYPLTNQFTDKT